MQDGSYPDGVERMKEQRTRVAMEFMADPRLHMTRTLAVRANPSEPEGHRVDLHAQH